MLNGIKNQVGFGYNITSAQLMQKLPEANANLASKPAAPRLIEEDNSKKSSGHPVLWTLGTLAVVGLAGFAANKNLFGEKVKTFVDEKIIDKSKTFYTETAKPKLIQAKDWVKNLFGKKTEVKPETAATAATETVVEDALSEDAVKQFEQEARDYVQKQNSSKKA